jgi:hypothetical protein
MSSRVNAGRARTLVALAAALTAVLFAGAGTGVASAVDVVDGEAPESAVTIVQTPAPEQGQCLPALLALTNSVRNDAETFTLRITASAPVCPAVDAAAVVYAMPGNGEAWPQELVERVDFTISEAGVTEVIFDKGCAPVQFDVITGVSPQTISPTGEWHGPLLFPLDTGTALQYSGGGEGCTPETTTTTESTTTTTEPEVLGSTTIPGSTTVPEVLAVTTLPETSGVAVLGSTQTPNAPAALALTGATSGSVATVGALLLALGALLVVGARRRSTN